MNTLDASLVLGQVWSLWNGTDWVEEPPDTAEFATLRRWLDQRLRQAWSYYEWPEVVAVEQRYYRPFWATLAPMVDEAGIPILDTNGQYILDAKTYDAGDEVFYPPTQKYYVCLGNTITSTPADTSGVVQANWAELADSYTADPWSPTTDYALRDQVVSPDDDQVYECTLAHTSGAAFEAIYWGQLVPFRRYVRWEEIYEQPIGEVLGVYDKDPRQFRLAAQLPFVRTRDGAEIHSTQVKVWVRWRRRCPRLVGAAWSASRTYAVREQVYFERSDGRGDWYACWLPTAAGQSPETNPANWTVVEIPARFEPFLTRACMASAHAADKEWLRATEQERQALAYLDDEIGKVAGEDWADKRLEVYQR